MEPSERALESVGMDGIRALFRLERAPTEGPEGERGQRLSRRG